MVATYSLLPGVLSASSVIIFCKKSRVIGEAYVGIGSFLYQTHNNKGLGMLFASPYDAADSSWYESMLPLPLSSNAPTISSMGTTPSLGPAGWSRLPPSGKYNAPHYRRRPIDDTTPVNRGRMSPWPPIDPPTRHSAAPHRYL